MKRGRKLTLLHMDNWLYMRVIRCLLICATIFLFIESCGFLIHYSYFNKTEYDEYDDVTETINFKIIGEQNINLSDIMIYFGFLFFILSSIGAYYVALHRFLLTNQQSKNTSNCSGYSLNIICITCYILISLTAFSLSFVHLFMSFDPKFFYILLICFDVQLILSSIPVFKALKKVIEISRDSAKSVRWSVTSVSPKKLYYKMSVKAVRMGMVNILTDILLIMDIGYDIYEIINLETNLRASHNDKHPEGIPSKMHYSHFIIIYFIQLFIMLFTVDYTWINRKYVTVKETNNKTNKSTEGTSRSNATKRRYTHTRQSPSDFDYNNTVLNSSRVIRHDADKSSGNSHIVKLKAAATMTPEQTTADQSQNAEAEYGDLESMS